MHFVRSFNPVGKFYSLKIRLAVISVIVLHHQIATIVEAKPSKACKYWCEEEGRIFYCCPSGKRIKDQLFTWAMKELFDLHDHPWQYANSLMYYLWPVIFQRSSTSSGWTTVSEEQLKPSCPEVRLSCPRTYDWQKLPTVCHDDSECWNSEKCCYDICLDRKTCKTSVTTNH